MHKREILLWFRFLPASTLLLSAAGLQAQNISLAGEAEAGRRSTSEDADGEETEDDYDYSRYKLDIGAQPSERIRHDIDAAFWNKDYKTLDDLDSQTRAFGFTPSFLLRRKEADFLKLDFRTTYREKRYDNQPRSEFNQAALQPRITLAREKAGSLSFLAGWRHYGYLNAPENDQSVCFQKTDARGYFLDEKLYLRAAYRMDVNNYNKEGRDKRKHEISGGAAYRFSRPWLGRLSVSGAFGRRDAREIEGRDLDLDLSFQEFQIATEHALSPAVKAALKYAWFDKDFHADRYDAGGRSAGAGLDIVPRKGEEYKTAVRLDTAYKEVVFGEREAANYRLTTAGILCSLERVRSWKAGVGYETALYDFCKDENRGDKNRHTVSLDTDQLFSEGRIVLSLLLKYRHTDRLHQPDSSQISAALACAYKF